MQISPANRRDVRLLPQFGGMIVVLAAVACASVAVGQTAPLFPFSDPQADAPASPIPAESLSYRAFPVRYLSVAEARERLSALLANAPGIDVVIDNSQSRLLVRGSAQTHQLVEQMLQNLDRPATAQTQTPSQSQVPAGETKIEAYPLTDASRDTLAKWQQQTAGRQDIRVAIDERTSQALIYAPPSVHAQIHEQLAQAGQRASEQNGLRNLEAAGSATNAEAPINGLASPAGTVTLQLRNLPGAELHTRLERLLVRPLPVSVDASGEWQGFSVEASPGVGVTMSVNGKSGRVRIDGPPLQVAAWRSVVEAMDSPPATQGAVTQLVATKPASHARVRQALQVLQTNSTAKAGDAPGNNRLVTMLFQPRDAEADGEATQPNAAAQPAPATNQPAPQGVTPGDAQRAIELAEAAGSLLGPVQVEFVEGLDVIVLRGSERDVQRVMEIINQIEELSSVTVPAIEIYELKNVSSEVMGALLTRLYAQVLGPRIGEVSITPLVKPNALLLIGRTENVQMAVDLIQRLDQPVSPTGRFEVFTLENASAVEAKAIIDGFLGQGEEAPAEGPVVEDAEGEAMPTLAPRALVVADPRTNLLIVSASPRDLAEIAALISKIDTPGVSAALKVFTIRNGDAQSLADMLRTLFGVSEDQQAAAGPGLSQGGPVRVQFSVDARTNSIIAAGSQDDLAVVEAILLRLDEGELRERINTVYRLKNAFANDVAIALQQMLQTERTAETEAELAISPFEQIEREVVIVPEIASNSLLISATPRYYERIKELIEQLDERPPMVLIQVLIAEVRLNDTDQFGVELGLQDSLLFDRSLLSDVQTITTTTTNQVQGTAVTVEQQNIINANGQPGFNFNNPNAPLGNNLSTNALATAGNVAAQGLSNFAVNRLDPTLGFSGFVFSASSDAVSVLLRALQENRRLEVLSRPQLMALDGQPGFVQVGQNVPTILATTIDPIAGTTNAITYQQVGLILNVVPRISPDGLVVMQITANKSEVGPEIEGIPISITPAGQVLRAPRIEVTEAQTTVSALSGQTVVLGGLIQTRKSDVHRRVPIIADIPLIGDLFRYDSVSEERRELLIIMTPQIIYGKADSDLVKQIESSRMSYCLADVVNVHGEAGLRSRCDEWFDGETEAVYPTYIPQDGEVLPPGEGAIYPGNGSMMEMPPIEATPAPDRYDSMPTLTPAAPLPVPPPPSQSSSIEPPLTSRERDSSVVPAAYYEASGEQGDNSATNPRPTRLPQTNQ